MGIYDRDYYREPPRGNAFSNIAGWSVTTWLIIVNVAVFVVDSMIGYPLRDQLGYFSIDTAVFHVEIWRFFTLQFLHANIPHIFYNMLALYFFGPMVEPILGARRYLAFYLICGVASGAMFAVMCLLNILGDNFATPLVGASGSIFGVLVAAAVVAPNEIVRIDFFFPVTIRTAALLMLGIAVVMVLRNGDNAGGEAAHIGGALMGYLLIKKPRMLDFANYRRGPRMRYRP